MLYLLLALAQLVPLWASPYVATMDGPSHTYNAWLLRHLGDERLPHLAETLELDLRPLPNWTAQAAMAAAMLVVPPLLAEKLVLSAYVLLFLAGAWYACGAIEPANRLAAFLALPLVYHQLFLLGFYNFAIGAALLLWSVGFFWRHRRRPGPARILALHALLLGCWFSHLVAFAVALGAIGLLWLAAWRRQEWRRQLLWPLALAPQLVLPVWFLVSVAKPGSPAGTWSGEAMVRYLAGGGLLYSLDPRQLPIGAVLMVAVGLLALLSLRRGDAGPEGRAARLPGWPFLLAALTVAALFALAPDKAAGGGLIKSRLAILALLLALPGLTPRLGPRARVVAATFLAALALVHAAVVTHGLSRLAEQVAPMVTAMERITPGTRALVLQPHRSIAGSVIAPLHFPCYGALRNELLLWNNYEPVVGIFGLRYRQGVDVPETVNLVRNPQHTDIARFRHRTEFILLWDVEPSPGMRRELRRRYALALEDGPARLYQHRWTLR